MDAKETLKAFNEELDADKKEFEQIDILLKTARAAGENVADLEQTQREIKAKIERWQKAIKANLK